MTCSKLFACYWPITRRIYPSHQDVIKWKHFPHYFVRRIHWSPVDSPHKGQWRGALMFSSICSRTNGWANTRDAGDLRRQRSYYDVTVMDSSDFTLYLISFRFVILWSVLCKFMLLVYLYNRCFFACFVLVLQFVYIIVCLQLFYWHWGQCITARLGADEVTLQTMFRFEHYLSTTMYRRISCPS